MSEPEIARRCSACGASVRQRAMFCPQCGSAMPQPTATHTEGVRGQVEKIRKVSSVMIDQAAYDPSLRFLLVAAGLFILFLVLLILSKVIG
jgi:predicted amidophosphoribosyltransferase